MYPERPPPSPLPGRLSRVVRAFLRTESSAGIVLLVAAAVALAWANSPWREGYQTLWHAEVEIALGDTSRATDLRHLVNEALMALFFFVVGLEIKRELVAGELRPWRRAALPACAAVGGMVVPAGLYALVNVGHEGSRGWGVPMATDIAFAVGVVALAGSRVPASLKVFLLSVAIVDDIGAIVVIAVFYAEEIRAAALAVGAITVAAIVVVRASRVTWMPVYVVLAIILWSAIYESGVHATVAGVVLGLLTPAQGEGSVAERVERRLHPFTGFVVVPIFALANAGVVLDRDALDPPGASRVVLGIVLGLVAGKLLGITGATWLALRLRVGDVPEGVMRRDVAGVAAVAGIGFTVALFTAGLAFDDPALEEAAKVGILVASVIASLMGLLLLRWSRAGRVG